MPTLKITEIFYSLQGEALTVGWPTVFVRLTGCPLRCVYCDSAYAFSGGARMTIAAIMQRLAQYKTNFITVTGGEPLAQPECLELLDLLVANGYQVSIETSGALNISGINNNVSIIMDIKTPASLEVHRNNLDNLAFLKKTDAIKFVIKDAEDFSWSVDMLRQYRLDEICTVLFSPVADQLEPRELADWILLEQLPVRFQMQLHKYLWGNVPGK